MHGALFTQWTPDQRHSWVKPNTTHLDPHLPLELKDCLGLLDGEGREDLPIFGQLLVLGVGLEPPVGVATREMVDDIFSPLEVELPQTPRRPFPEPPPAPHTSNPVVVAHPVAGRGPRPTPPT